MKTSTSRNVSDNPSKLDTRGARPGFGGRLAAASVLALCIAVPAFAQGDQPTLDELLNLEPAQPEAQEQEQQPSSEPAEPGAPGEAALEESVERMLSGREAANVFEQAVREMDDVSQRLAAQRDAGIETQRMQQRIIDKLNQVIGAARRQQQQQSGGGGGGQQQPQDQRQQDAGGEQLAQQQQPSGASQGAAGASSQSGQSHSGEASPGQAREGQAAGEPMRELRREWGSLPPRLREEISEGLNERFSPVYRELTEAYYRQLAEEE